MTTTRIRGLVLAAAAASALGLTTLAAPAQAQYWGGPHVRHGWGGGPAYGYGGWRGHGPRPYWRGYGGYAPRCVSRPRWVPGPWGMRRVWVRRCW